MEAPRPVLNAWLACAWLACGLACSLAGAAMAAAQTQPAATQPAATHPATTQTTPPPAAPHVSVLSGDEVVQILDETVEWYRTLGTQQQSASQPSDLLILYANQQTAAQVVALAFDIARANAELLSSEASNAPQAPD